MTDLPPRHLDQPGSPEADEPRKRKVPPLLIVLVCIIAILVIAISWTIGLVISGVNDSSNNITQVKVVIDYDGNWSGSLGDIESLATYGGNGSHSYLINAESTGTLDVSASIQKNDDSSSTLTVNIEKMDGTILTTSSTSAAHGVVTVVWTNL